MKYRHVIDKPDYAGYASGKVLLWGRHPNSSSPIGRKASSTPVDDAGLWHAGRFGPRLQAEFIRQPL